MSEVLALLYILVATLVYAGLTAGPVAQSTPPEDYWRFCFAAGLVAAAWPVTLLWAAASVLKK